MYHITTGYENEWWIKALYPNNINTNMSNCKFVMLFLDWLAYEDIAKGDLVVNDDTAFIVSISGSHPQIFISA